MTDDLKPSRRAWSVVGRDGELAELDCLLRGGGAGGGVVLVGGAGVGKTTLWETAVSAARARGERVLVARPTGSELELPFAGMIDLFDELGPAELAVLAAPQRRALEAALLRTESHDASPATGVVAAGFCGVVRALAAQARVLVAVDDLQWLDPLTLEALVFLARRLGGRDVGFLLVRRPGRTGLLERLLARGELARVEVGPLSLGAVRRLLFERLGLTVSRPLLRRIMDATGGNPLFALEVGRSLLERGLPSPSEGLPLPESVEELLDVRVSRLPASVRRLLLAVAVSDDPRVGVIEAITGPAAIDDAVDAGVLLIDGQRVRPSHPLLASAVLGRSHARERRALHLALAGAINERQSRVLHLALAGTRPDGRLAARVAAAAEQARAQGTRQRALMLAEHALRLTPPEAPDRPARVLALAERLDDAGELRRLTALLELELPSLPAGPPRARAWLLLSDAEGVASIREQDDYVERALAECGADRDLRAYVLAKRANNAAAAAISGLRDAEGWAVEALDYAEHPRTLRFALYAMAWVRALTGRPVDDLCERSAVAADPGSYISASPERVAGKRLLWRGELESAANLWRSLAKLADERGELTSYAMLRLHLCELELRRGGWVAAAALLDEWAQSSDFDAQFRPQYQRCQALLAAGRGDPDETRRWASDAIQRARAAACVWDELEARRASGVAALLAREPERAVEELRVVWEHCEREGVLEPSAFPVAPELVEAFLEVGATDAARAIADRLGDLAERQDHPWGRATARRCEALVSLTGSDHDAGAVELREAAGELERLGFRFDSARCLVSLGRTQRRLKRWAAARETLESAHAAFSAIGSDGWAKQARSELQRLGGRRRPEGELTPSERRVVELAADGLANKQIASALYITVNTVEKHLARAYAKLGVRSRTQLAKRLITRG